MGDEEYADKYFGQEPPSLDIVGCPYDQIERHSIQKKYHEDKHTKIKKCCLPCC